MSSLNLHDIACRRNRLYTESEYYKKKRFFVFFLPFSRRRRAAASMSLGLGSYLASGDSRRSGTGRPDDDDGWGLTRSCCCCCCTFLTVAMAAKGSARTARPSIKARRPRRLSGTTTPAPIIWLKITHTKIGIFSCSMILDLRVSNTAFLERRLLNSLSSRISSFFSQL